MRIFSVVLEIFIWPNSGYLTRQISFLLNSYVYREGEDLENPGLLIPRYRASGRTAPSGKIYPEFKGNQKLTTDVIYSILSEY